jgi:cell division protein FtsZ
MTTKIKVIGIGGAGGNAISRMKKSKFTKALSPLPSGSAIAQLEFIAINTDYQDLKKIKADLKLRIGQKITQGLGTGMDPEIGRKAAEEQRDEITAILKGTDMIFLTGGLGGGTFTGAGPVIAEISKKLGILTIAICTLPFSFEGNYRRKIALAGKEKLQENVDALIAIKNDKLLENLDNKISLLNAFWLCDDILREGVRGISDLIMLPGIINIDFASVKTILKEAGTCLFGIGRARGEKRAEMAAQAALYSPLLDALPKGAKGILFNVSGKDISLSEIEQIGRIFTQEINPQARVLFGAVEDEKLKKGELKVTLIATGF